MDSSHDGQVSRSRKYSLLIPTDILENMSVVTIISKYHIPLFPKETAAEPVSALPA
jgi:hypothetical protein